MMNRWLTVLMLGTILALPLVMVGADESGSPAANEGEAHHWIAWR